MKNLTTRQQRIAKQIKADVQDTNTVNDALAASMAVLITTIEDCNEHINKHGVLLVETGSRKQQITKENPAVNTRDKAIKQLNVIARTIKIETEKVKESSLNDLLNNIQQINKKEQ
ncbi:P27 family phage terminase small subunit [Vibrio sp. SM6]|uniref:P27 family phage terminase small subunit n=1 Tax=Vibrio agarilyticus TaxID=2726741 RepID=A0A7X8YGU0_9VIBR|nr:P27 family phage terminase small subunit [Vibrio agarilyticus]NLS13014.1 P27 family phage terminase small subunit [Vibrio agarilyticus]